MDEAQRFLRFVLPGVLYVVASCGLLLLLRPDLLAVGLPYLKDSVGMAGVLGALIASGGLGFIFSMVFHEMDWRSNRSPLNHRGLVTRLMKAKRICVKELTDARHSTDLDVQVVDRSTAHDIVNALWHERREREPFKSAHPKMVSLLDVAYSLGIAAWAIGAGAVTAFIAAAVTSRFSAEPGDVARFAIAVVLGTLVPWAYGLSYLRVGRFAARFIAAVLSDYATAEIPPVTTHFMPFSRTGQSSGGRSSARQG